MDEETRHSLECIQANQIFPRKQLIREDENLQVPFLELHGESTEYVGRAEDAIIALSNYRLHIKFKESLVNTASQSAASAIPVPLQLIESVECRDIFQLHLTCKDCKVIRCQFSTFEQCQEWLKRLNNAIRPPAKIEDLFSFAYHAWCMEVYASEKEQHGDLCRPDDETEVQRGQVTFLRTNKEVGPILEPILPDSTPERPTIVLHQEPELGDAALRSHPGTSLLVLPQGIPEQQGGNSILPSSLQEPPRGEDAQEVPVEQSRIGVITQDREEAVLPISVDVKVGSGTSQSSSLPSQVSFETRGPNVDSSMDMLVEDKVKSESGPQGHERPCLPARVSSGRFSGKEELPQAMEPRPSERSLAERPQVGSLVYRTSPSSTQSPAHSPCALPLAECKEGLVCNGAPETENKASEQLPGRSTLQKYPTPNGHCANGETARSKDSLSRQLSATSCSSAHLHSRNLHHKWLHSHSGRASATGSPDQPSRSHLDDDGMPVYTDTIQQRLRQIESGHQQEVETLKKQVQELRSRLESQYLTSSLRFNGDFGDEVTSIPDSESILDQNCLSRCSTEIFSEASWEQVDKQDTEMTRWLPDHLAAHCYACDSAFWLASRKHHCRDIDRVDQTWNCGNVFCSSCCNQKVPVPSQQLFEPSRVCKSCYSSLHPTSSSIDLELDKPIAATSN
eukprot:XP_028336330.1 myotubularin-related protein 3 [Physeter catodon]